MEKQESLSTSKDNPMYTASPATVLQIETSALCAHLVDQNTAGKGKLETYTYRAFKASSLHTHTPDKRQGKQCHLFPSLLSESMIASTITSCLSCPGDRRKPDSTQIRAGANLMRWRSTQTQCCVNALLSAPGRSSLAKFSPPLETFKMAVAQSRTQRDPPA